jgi:hypothetical protein
LPNFLNLNASILTNFSSSAKYSPNPNQQNDCEMADTNGEIDKKSETDLELVEISSEMKIIENFYLRLYNRLRTLCKQDKESMLRFEVSASFE